MHDRVSGKKLAALTTSLLAPWLLATTVWAGEAPAPVLSAVGGTGVPGGTVAVTLNVENSDGAVDGGADLVFDPDVIGINFDNCSIDERLEETHNLAGRVEDDDTLILEIVVSGTPEVRPPLGDGTLVSCSVDILPGVPAGTTGVQVLNPLLGDNDGMPLPNVEAEDGVITIQEAAFTPTATPQEATPTATQAPTDTPTGGPTDTPTGEVSPTDTPTVGPTDTPTGEIPPTATEPPTARPTSSFDQDDSCAIVPVEQSNPFRSLVLLVGPAALLWRRRRF